MSKRVRFTVEPRRGDWALTEGGRTLKEFESKEDAVAAGRRAGHAAADAGQPSQLIIKKADGTIQTEHTYTNDPFPPPG